MNTFKNIKLIDVLNFTPLGLFIFPMYYMGKVSNGYAVLHGLLMGMYIMLSILLLNI